MFQIFENDPIAGQIVSFVSAAAQVLSGRGDRAPLVCDGHATSLVEAQWGVADSGNGYGLHLHGHRCHHEALRQEETVRFMGLMSWTICA